MKKYVRKEELNELTLNLVNSIKSFSDSLPNDEVYELKKMINKSVSLLPETVENATQLNGKLEVIRGMIKVNSNLDECKNYLTMAEKLRFGITKELVKKVNDFTSIVNNTFSMAI